LHLPEKPQYDIGDEPTEYNLDITNQTVHSQYVLTDQPKANSSNKLARKSSWSTGTCKHLNQTRLGRTRIAGKIKHHASLKPVMSDQYIARIRRRAAEANRPKKSIVMLEDRQDAGGSNLKMVQSGAIQTNAGFNLSVRQLLPL